MLFSVVAKPVYIPANTHKSSVFSTASATLAISCLSVTRHSNRCEVILEKKSYIGKKHF